jgi:hypothetical protein
VVISEKVLFWSWKHCRACFYQQHTFTVEQHPALLLPAIVLPLFCCCRLLQPGPSTRPSSTSEHDVILPELGVFSPCLLLERSPSGSTDVAGGGAAPSTSGLAAASALQLLGARGRVKGLVAAVVAAAAAVAAALAASGSKGRVAGAAGRRVRD